MYRPPWCPYHGFNPLAFQVVSKPRKRKVKKESPVPEQEKNETETK
jgi:hypothetical protein